MLSLMATIITHVTPKSDHAVNVAKALYTSARQTSTVNAIILLGCDGTNVIIELRNGFQYLLGRECPIVVCLLRGNE